MPVVIIFIFVVNTKRNPKAIVALGFCFAIHRIGINNDELKRK
jgi:hypothetical protein